jgi:hypothetical protein
MENKFISFLLVIGLIASLAACRPAGTVESETTVPPPSQVPETETANPAPSEAPVVFDCQSVSEIPSSECQALVAFPDTLDFESQAFREFEQKNYEEYLKEQVDMLDALPSGQFEPDLAMLDQIVASLEIQPQ